MIENFMRRDIPFLQAKDTLAIGIDMLRHHKADALPVINETGSLVGALTKANIIDAYIAGISTSEKIANHCKSQVTTVHIDFPFSLVKERIINSSIGNAIVVDNNNKVLGVLDKNCIIESLLHENQQLSIIQHVLCDNNYCGIIFLDSSGGIQSINDLGVEILGISEDEIIGKSFQEITGEFDIEEALLNSFDINDLEIQIYKADTICSIKTINYGNKAIGKVILFINKKNKTDSATMGQLKRWNTSFRTVLNVIYESVLVVDYNGKIMYVNNSFCEFMGRSANDLIDRSINGLDISSELYKVIKTGTPHIDATGINKTNGRKYVMSIFPIIKRNKIQGAVSMIAYHSIEELTEVSKRLLKLDSNMVDNCDDITRSITFNDFITINQHMQQLKKEAKLAAQGKSTVLITGESGTGKEIIAESIHNASPRRRKSLITVNCAAIPDNLLEAEFFGYAPGAFTGADKKGKKGKFAAADGGTLFLDEIGDMSLNLQSKLLRVLENNRVEPVGSNDSIEVDVRIIAATNQNLNSKVATGEFRSDLYYRLNVINLHLLPLRDRKEDIIPLVEFFIAKFNRTQHRHIINISSEVRQLFLSYSWPGNVRELVNIIERAFTYATGNQMETKDLPLYLREQSINASPHPEKDNNAASNQTIELNKETIKKALNDAKGNKSKAAKMLGISRTWLYDKIRKYDL